MPKYAYTAADQSGKLINGFVEAATREMAVDQLVAQSLIPASVSLGEKRRFISLTAGFGFQPTPLADQDLSDFTRQLASLLRSGLTVDRSLAIVRSGGGKAGIFSEALLAPVRRGVALSEALSQQPGTLPPYYISMVRAGEEGGALAIALAQIADLLDETLATRGRIVAALIYPSILMATIVLSLILIVSLVLPQFDAIFAEAGQQLPMPTMIVMVVGQVLRQHGLLLLLLAVAGLVAATWLLKLPRYRLRMDRFLTRRAFYQRTLGKLEAARFSRTLGMLTQGGLTLPRAFKLATGTVNNTALAASLREVLVSTSAGGQLGTELGRVAALPTILIQMARVGLETGRLSDSLCEAADILDNDARRTIDRSLAVAVPLITVAMGILVAALIGSVLIGILSVNDLAG